MAVKHQVRSHFYQPPTGHEGMFSHAWSPTDGDRMEQAMGCLGAGGWISRMTGTNPTTGNPVTLYSLRDVEGRFIDSLPAKAAEGLLAGLQAEEVTPQLTRFRGKK